MRWLAALSPLLAACSRGAPLPPVDLVQEGSLTHHEASDVANGVDILGPDGCDLALAPDPELFDATADAVAQWDEALPGCWVRIDIEHGVPVTAVDDVLEALAERDAPFTGEHAVAATRIDPGVNVPEHWRVRELLIERGHDWTLAHELGHALGAFEHTAEGLMAFAAGITRVGAGAVAAVCRRSPCGVETEGDPTDD